MKRTITDIAHDLAECRAWLGRMEQAELSLQRELTQITEQVKAYTVTVRSYVLNPGLLATNEVDIIKQHFERGAHPGECARIISLNRRNKNHV